MIFSVVILMLISVTVSQDTLTSTLAPVITTTEAEQTSSPAVPSSTNTTEPGDTTESQTTTQQIIIEQTTPMDVTNNTQTTTSTWLTQIYTVLETSTSTDAALNSTEEAFPEDPISTVAVGDREGQDLEGNPGLIAVLCIFCIVVAVIVVVAIVKAVRSRKPHFERLDDVPMGKMTEDAPFARYPPK